MSGGTRRNREWVEPQVSWDAGVPEWQRWLLCDAMTSGGLLVAAAPGSGAPGIEIGRVTGTQSASRLRPPVFVRAARATASSSAADVRPAPTQAKRNASPASR